MDRGVSLSPSSFSPPTECYVVLHIGAGPSASQDRIDPMIVRDSDPRFQLTHDIWIERLDKELAKNIQTACEPRHYNINNAGYDRHLYGFFRRVSTVEKSRYEGLSDLHALIALSRLVNPTSTGDRYSARIFRYGEKDSPIHAISFYGVSPDVSLGSSPRDWLSIQDGETLRKLLPWLGKTMHKRIHRAYWNHEFAMRSYYLDVKWTLIVSGFEALVNTRDKKVRKQFRDRVRQLADEFKINLTNDELNDAYTLRSKLVHAQNFLFDLETILPKSKHTALYGKLESLLRQTLLRCFLDENFGHLFRDDDSVEKRWPS
jgi:hypothetical protein